MTDYEAIEFDGDEDWFSLGPEDERSLASYYADLFARVVRDMEAEKQESLPLPARWWTNHANVLKALSREDGSTARWVPHPDPKSPTRLLVPNACRERIDSAVASDDPVLITGETGSGKEGTSGYVIRNGNRCSKKSDTMLCARRRAAEFQIEMFGYVRGSHSEANEQRDGWVPRLEGGTLVLDEFGELNQECQVLLLRFVERKHYQRYGSNGVETGNVRIIATTNANPFDGGRIRSDLLARFGANHIPLPPLREQSPDSVCMLLYEYLRTSGVVSGITLRWLAQLIYYDWPGNIRELALYCDACTKRLHLGSHERTDRAVAASAGLRMSSAGPDARHAAPHILDGIDTAKFIRADRVDSLSPPIAWASQELLARYLRDNGQTIRCVEGEEKDLVLNSLRLLAQLHVSLARTSEPALSFHPAAVPLSFLGHPRCLPEAYARSVLEGGASKCSGTCNLFDALSAVGKFAARRHRIDTHQQVALADHDDARSQAFLSWIAEKESTVPAYGAVDTPSEHRLCALLDSMRADPRCDERDFLIVRALAAGKNQVQIASDLGLRKASVNARLVTLRGENKEFEDVLGKTRRLNR